ncbi:MAG: SO_0444 family Cu/Zn efflux transporter [Candidatus Omnitrophica bacterium]|nr:SO_0444 family Cu/Zn efflux transporter [Candidatus Omnitrophota bacterium]
MIKDLFFEFWRLLNEMSPYLLFGFLISGILKVIIPKEKVYNYLSSPSFSSVLKSAIIGIPLPLCSCGVIPVASHLENEGASKGATVSFLISTPTTGIDSIFATYSLLGPIFALIRPISAFFSGIFAGTITNIFEKNKEIQHKKITCANCNDETKKCTFLEKIKIAINYGFFELIQDTGKWILIGILIGSLISVFIPESIILKYLGNKFNSYLIMLLIGIPMYVCATGSIPIASSLILKGMSPGAGFVFLFTGPATNSATLTFILGKLGKRTFTIYILSIILWAIIFGLLIDKLLVSYDFKLISHYHQKKLFPYWFKNITSLILLFLILKTFKFREIQGNVKTFEILDMKCENCARTIENIFKKENINVFVNFRKKKIYVPENTTYEKVKDLVEKAGYHLKKEEGENG